MGKKKSVTTKKKVAKARKKKEPVKQVGFIFDVSTVMSDPRAVTKMSGFEITYDKSGKKVLGEETIYFHPLNSKQISHIYRWHSIKKSDLIRMIKVLQDLIK